MTTTNTHLESLPPLTLTLIMIMKNESPIITRCLDSIRKQIDYIVITDTGSTDDSVSKVENYLDTWKIKGKVFKDEWKNFGWNRTNSAVNGRTWLKEEGIDLERNFFITIDCDMKIVFKPEFDKQSLDKADSWMINQVNPVLTYYNMRFFRSSLNYKCVGVTHEYWDYHNSEDIYGNVRPNKTDKLSSVYIDDVGDGCCKADKFSRDIALLTQGIKDEPNNSRYYFYLAQSYCDSGDYMNAIEWYNKRIKAKGWIEEVFISYLKLGEIYRKIGKIPEAIYEWSKGYSSIPCRSETLYRIINEYRCSGDNFLAMLYLTIAIKIPFPKDCVLFIEHQIYSYRILEELSIIGFYANRFYEGLSSTQYLLHSKEVPGHLKNSVLRNSFFYIKPFTWDEHRVLDIKNISDGYKPSSSSLFLSRDEFYGTVRAVNYSINDSFQYNIRDPKNIVRTENYWLKTKNKGKTLKYYKIREVDSALNTLRDSHIKGLEDLKIAWLSSDKPIGIAVDWERGRNNHPSIVIVHFKMDVSQDEWTINKIVPVPFRDHECQKNWGIYTEEGKLYAIYSHSPLLILELDINTGKETVVFHKESPLDLSRIRGSSNPIKLPNGEWMVLTHEVVQLDTRKYFMRFLRYSKEWSLLGVSYPFYINNFFVEFSLSIIFTIKNGGGYFYIPFSTRDNTTEIVGVRDVNIRWLEVTENMYDKAVDINKLHKFIQSKF